MSVSASGPATETAVAERLRRRCDPQTVDDLAGLPQDIKVAVVQQFFQHVDEGSHKTVFDREVVPLLLDRWFGIRLADADDPDPAAAHATRRQELTHVDFGGTDVFFAPGGTRHRLTAGLVAALTDDVVLTVDKTSPPCELAEFVPLWMRERNLPPARYSLTGRTDHPIAGYFAGQVAAVEADFGVRMEHCSMEMGLVANGDALRFHRDRLVNQYAHLTTLGNETSAWRVVQDLTLVDWDMQPGTMSGTVLDHPGGDRFILVLDPGEVTDVFFSEAVRLPGPMMMPYHCALPVLDRAAHRTVGMAKGKRLSTLVRGIAPHGQVDALRDRAVALNLGAPSGVEVHAPAAPDADATAPLSIVDNDEGLCVVRLDETRNRALVEAVMPGAAAWIYHVEKHGEGFSALARAIPGLAGAGRVAIVNRSSPATGTGRTFPVTLDRTAHGLPWMHLPAMTPGAVLTCPAGVVDVVRVTPPDELLHRHGLLDSFHPAATAGGRNRVALDVLVA